MPLSPPWRGRLCSQIVSLRNKTKRTKNPRVLNVWESSLKISVVQVPSKKHHPCGLEAGYLRGSRRCCAPLPSPFRVWLRLLSSCETAWLKITGHSFFRTRWNHVFSVVSLLRLPEQGERGGFQSSLRPSWSASCLLQGLSLLCCSPLCYFVACAFVVRFLLLRVVRGSRRPKGEWEERGPCPPWGRGSGTSTLGINGAVHRRLSDPEGPLARPFPAPNLDLQSRALKKP